MRMKRKLVSIVLSLLLISILFSGCTDQVPTDKNTNNNQSSDPDSNEDTNEDTNGDEETQEVTFTEHLFELDKARFIVPLGELEGGWEEMEVNNMALVHIQREGDYPAPAMTMEVYAPTEMSLITYSYYSYHGSPLIWTLIFEINADITLRLSALTDVSDTIKNTVGTEYTIGEITLATPLSFTPGELIGYAGGSAEVTNWDILLYDKTHENQYVNQERYQGTNMGERYLTAICPFKFYPDEMQQEYINLFGFEEAGQTTDCGCASRDVEGTLSGIWWISPEGTDIEGKEMITSPLFIYSNSAGGTSLGYVNNKRYKIRAENPTNKDPATITDKHCYTLISAWDGSSEGYAYFKIISNTEMQLATSTNGECPSTFPTEYTTYYR